MNIIYIRTIQKIKKEITPAGKGFALSDSLHLMKSKNVVEF